MTKKDVVKLFDKINVWERGGQRAPHKSLLLLYALARCQQGADRLIPYFEIDDTLRKLLMEFGPPRKSYHPEYPFWRLQNDNIWEIPNKEKLARRKGNTDAKKSELLKHDVHGGFSQTIYEYLASDPELRVRLIKDILTKSFPESIHEDIIEAVGLSTIDNQKRPQRNPEFRDRVIRAYEHKCAVCGYNVKIGSSDLGLESAHIKWHAAGGPDIEQNGLSLCALHHKCLLEEHLQSQAI